jgi:acyl-coenzyme A thioesterase PaaI-like protein
VSAPRTDPGARLLASWNRLSGLPGGKTLFSWLAARMARYSGSIGARVRELEPGHCRITLRDRPAIRNHLASIHAVALTNLGELTSGLAMLTALPSGVRGIVVRLDTRYLKKARGTLTAECRCEIPAFDQSTDLEITAEIRDRGGDLVATLTATWKLDRRGGAP